MFKATENSMSSGTALITGASSGIGAIYADRLARRGHDLILVARNRERLDALARRLSYDTGRAIKVIVADLNDKADLAQVEQVLRSDATIMVLVNNAGIGAVAPLVDSDIDEMERMIDLNVTAVVRLTYAIVMKAADLVDAALAGLDQGELVTIPSLPDIADWEAFEAARQNMRLKLSRSAPAARYGVSALNSKGG